MMVLQHSSVGKSLLWHSSTLLNAKVGIFPLSYAVIPSFMLLFSDGPYPGLCVSLEVVLCEKCCCLVMDHIPGYVSP